MGISRSRLVRPEMILFWTAASMLRATAVEQAFESEMIHPAELRTASANTGAISAIGTRRVLYYRVAYKQDRSEPEPPVSVEEAESDMEKANNYFTRISRGVFSLEWVITPLLVLSNDQQYYQRPGGPDLILEDAREAAAAAGYDYLDFDFDLIRISTLAGSEAGGLGRIGQRGAWVEKSGPYIIAHELCHNLGLLHANFWATGRPDLSSLRFYPSGTTADDLERYPRTPDGLIGHESVFGPGESSEYGDPFDLMGVGGESPINAIYQYHLGWLSDSNMFAAPGNSKVRLYAFDTEWIEPERTYLVRVDEPLLQGRTTRKYWIQYRYDLGTNNAPGNGVLLYWNAESTQGPALLLDAESGGANRQIDSTLKLGRTFFDPVLDLFITPVERGVTAGAPWIDVEIVRQPEAGNRPPSLELEAPEPLGAGEMAVIQATAADPDGDELSYYWDFGDGTYGANAGTVLKLYDAEGEYVMRCEVSDRKGGKASRHLVVRVGDPATYRVSGQVRDTSGMAVADVRVHNGIYSRNAGSANYRHVLTDSDGRYTLTGLSSGSYSNAAYHLSYTCRTAGEEVTVITNQSVQGVDFVAEALPSVRLELMNTNLPENTSTLLRVIRTEPVEEALTVILGIGGGSAEHFDVELQGDWLVPLGMSSGIFQVRFPPGEAVAVISVQAADDGLCEEEENLIFAVQWPTEVIRTNGNEVITIPVPGWELTHAYGEMMWGLSRPSYVPAESQATLKIHDNSDSIPRIHIHAGNSASEDPLQDGAFVLSVQGCQPEELRIFYTVTGTAVNGVDYEQLSGELVIPPNESIGIIAIVPIADGTEEGEETIQLTLLPQPGYAVGTESAEIVVRDKGISPDFVSAETGADGRIAIWTIGLPGKRHVLETALKPSGPWIPIRTNLFFIDRASYQIEAHTLQPAQFFRSRVE